MPPPRSVRVGERHGRLMAIRDRWPGERVYCICEPGNCRWATYSEQARNRRPLAYAGTVRHPATGQFMPKGATA